MLYLAPYLECNHTVLLAATTASSLSFLNLFVPFSSPAAFLSINQTHIITGCVFMFEKKTISTNAKEDIKGASEIFS